MLAKSNESFQQRRVVTPNTAQMKQNIQSLIERSIVNNINATATATATAAFAILFPNETIYATDNSA